MKKHKIALIGAGGSAHKFLVNSDRLDFDLYTTVGGQTLFSKTSNVLSKLNPEDYQCVIMLIFDYAEVFQNMKHFRNKVQFFWFNALDNLLIDLSNNQIGNSIYVPEDENGLVKLELEENSAGGLTVVYDFAAEPMTFDFLTFLVHVEMERRKRSLDYIEIIIPPGPYEGFYKYDLHMQKQVKENRFHNILQGLVRLLNCPVYVSRTATRENAKILWEASVNKYPMKVDFSAPSPLHSIKYITQRGIQGENMFVFEKIDDFARGIVFDWMLEKKIDKAKFVTLTLRESKYNSSKNSNIIEWLKFADYLAEKGYSAVFIRDTDKALLALPEWPNKYPVFSIASFDFVMRMTLSQLAFANLGVNNGCNLHWFFTESIRYAMIKVVDSNHLPSTPEHLNMLGIDPKSGVVGSKCWQIVTDDKDDLANIIDCFVRLENKIDN